MSPDERDSTAVAGAMQAGKPRQHRVGRWGKTLTVAVRRDTDRSGHRHPGEQGFRTLRWRRLGRIGFMPTWQTGRGEVVWHGGGDKAMRSRAVPGVRARRGVDEPRYEGHDEHRRVHRITSSAWKRRVGGIVRPRAWAVLRLMTSSNCVGSSTGRSAGLVPFKMRSTWAAARRNNASQFGP
jgi:hypothetical protein